MDTVLWWLVFSCSSELDPSVPSSLKPLPEEAPPLRFPRAGVEPLVSSATTGTLGPGPGWLWCSQLWTPLFYLPTGPLAAHLSLSQFPPALRSGENNQPSLPVLPSNTPGHMWLPTCKLSHRSGSDVSQLHPPLGERPPGQQLRASRLASCAVTGAPAAKEWPVSSRPHLHVGDPRPQRVSHPGRQVLHLLL